MNDGRKRRGMERQGEGFTVVKQVSWATGHKLKLR